MAISQKEFCAIVSKLKHHDTSLERSGKAALGAMERLAGNLQFAQRSLLRDIKALSKNPLDQLSVPVDANFVTELVSICPGLFPADAKKAIVIASALQAAFKGPDPLQAMNQMLNNPAKRLQRIRNAVQGVGAQFTSLLKGGLPGKASIPGVDALAKAATKVLIEEASAFAVRSVLDGLQQSGFNVAAAERCARNLCAVGARYQAPG